MVFTTWDLMREKLHKALALLLKWEQLRRTLIILLESIQPQQRWVKCPLIIKYLTLSREFRPLQRLRSPSLAELTPLQPDAEVKVTVAPDIQISGVSVTLPPSSICLKL